MMANRAPRDGHRLALTVLAAAWVMAFFYSFISYALTPADDIGVATGLDRVETFLGWQGVAGLFALSIFGVSRKWPASSSMRHLGVAPLGILAVLAFLGAAIVVWAKVA